ncbi:MAG: hypothetical protein KGS44_13155 [Alphaproteobacteria bacterium]|nr:hypothetical protein [Alphaproteobacteria bacterium]
MSERIVIRSRIGKRLAYVHPPSNGRIVVFIPDQFQKADLHNEVVMTPREAIRLGRALIKQAGNP